MKHTTVIMPDPRDKEIERLKKVIDELAKEIHQLKKKTHVGI